MKTLSEITKDALDLSPSQRLTLVRILLDLSDETEGSSVDFEAAWEEEIVRRLAEVKAGRARSDCFERVVARLDTRFRK